MYFYLIGIDYRIAPIEIREAAYWQRARISRFLTEHYAGRSTILSTCNRFEIYGVTENRHEAEAAVAALRERFTPLFDGAYVIYQENNVLKHLVRLAAGVESLVLGELQISGQLGAWAGHDRFPVPLGRLVYDALLAANDIRIEHGLNRPEKNIAVYIYDRVLAETEPDRLLNMIVLGTGSIASLFADYKPRGVRLSFAARKNILKAAYLAERSGGDAFLLQELPCRLVDADVLISATASPHRILGKNYFSKIAMLRKKDLYVYDLALPRDIEPAVKDIEGIILKNIDEVVVNADIKNRLKAEPVSH